MSTCWKALFAGDFYASGLPEAGWLDSSLKKIISEHAIVSCNFEAPVEFENAKPIPKTGPAITQNSDTPAYLESAGFNVINLANNHIFDYGLEGFEKTTTFFKKAVCVGAGHNFDSAYALKIKEVHDLKVGFLSFSENQFGCLTENQPGGYAWVNHPDVEKIIRQSKSQCAVLLVQVHAGVEMLDVPLPEWRKRYQQLIEAGADAVIGHHPHVPQGWEMHQGKPIFYSLGNFYFDMNHPHKLWNTGMMVSLIFEDSSFKKFEIIPIKNSNGIVSQNPDPEFVKHLQKICSLLNLDSYINEVNTQVLKLWKSTYQDYYVRALNGLPVNSSVFRVAKALLKWVFKRNTRPSQLLLLHNLKIESHRWVVERALALLTRRS